MRLRLVRSFGEGQRAANEASANDIAHDDFLDGATGELKVRRARNFQFGRQGPTGVQNSAVLEGFRGSH